MNIFIIQEKGRNAITALKNEFSEKNLNSSEIIDEISTRINGIGKNFAKGEIPEDLKKLDLEEVKKLEDLEKWFLRSEYIDLKENDRINPRPVIKRIESENKVIEGIEFPGEAWRKNPDRFYAGYDQILETGLSVGDIDPSDIHDGMKTIAKEYMNDKGYLLKSEEGDKVKWAIMYDSKKIPNNPRLILVPEKFKNLGSALAKKIYNKNINITTINEYREKKEKKQEEEVISRASKDKVSGIYMYVSGNTAKSEGLRYKPVFLGEKSISRLGVFER